MIPFLSVLLGVVGGGLAGYAAARKAMRVPPPGSPEPGPPPAPVAQPTPPEPEPAELSEETLAVLTAAVAAFLGKHARVRRARLAPRAASGAWAQQGRVFVQASHNLSRS